MNLEDIKERNQYHYKRNTRGVTRTGVLLVAEVYPRAGRWWIVGLDAKLGRNVTLQPGQVVRPVRAR